MQAEQEDVLPRPAGNQKMHMVMIMKLGAKKKKTGAWKVEMKQLAQQLAEVHVTLKMDVIDWQAKRNVVAGMEVTERKFSCGLRIRKSGEDLTMSITCS